MGVLKKIVEKLDNVADKKIADVVEKAGVPPKPEPSPKLPPKADTSVAVPTPMGGGCFRLIEAASFGGVVVATLVAALVGRCRR